MISRGSIPLLRAAAIGMSLVVGPGSNPRSPPFPRCRAYILRLGFLVSACLENKSHLLSKFSPCLESNKECPCSVVFERSRDRVVKVVVSGTILFGGGFDPHRDHFL